MVLYRYLFYFFNCMNMPISKFSDEYYERQCYLKTDTVPTQSVMRKRMSPALAKVCFKSMTPKCKLLAGLAPPLKGGGRDWLIPPRELFKERMVLQPINKEYLSKMTCDCIVHFGEKIVKDNIKKQEQIKAKKLEAFDDHWKSFIDAKCLKYKLATEQKVALMNKTSIERGFREFCSLYNTSLIKLEDLLLAAAINEIQRVKTDTVQYMKTRYETLITQQAKCLYDLYNARLLKMKESIKTQFIANKNESQKLLENQMHDINVEKHTVIEKLRNFLECQNLACQVYVALKDREECKKTTEVIEREHKKEIKLLSKQIDFTNFEIKCATDKGKKRQELQDLWYKKICEVVRKFQLFVSYSLKELPEYAEFFINTEKVVLLHLEEVLENPHVESIFKTDSHTPVPRARPYFLFCDKGYKPHIDEDLCPKQCTSSASQFPVIVVNNRFIYAACDNFKTFTDKVTKYVDGKRDDEDLVDDHDYTCSAPIKYTASDQIQHLKLESSLQQLLQNEWANVRNLPLECLCCKFPHCFCSSLKTPPMPTSEPGTVSSETLNSIKSGNKISSRAVELEHERQPKWKSYMEYVKSNKCKCSLTSQKHLEEHLPPYMKQMSVYEAPELPHYEICGLETVKKLVKQAQGKRKSPPAQAPPKANSRDVETQYSDPNFDHICTCFSDEEVEKIFKGLPTIDQNAKGAHCDVVTGSITPSYLNHSMHSFVTRRTSSLKKLLDASPELEDIFRRKDCKD